MEDRIFENQALNRLLILYFIQKSGRRFTKDQLARMFFDNKLMNYYNFMSCAADLCAEGLLGLEEDGDGGAYYVITENAAKLLPHISDSIPRGLRVRVGAMLDDADKSVREQAAAFADYFRDEDDFLAECRFMSGNAPILDLKLSAATEDFSKKICANWKKYAHEIYLEIVDALLKERS